MWVSNETMETPDTALLEKISYTLSVVAKKWVLTIMNNKRLNIFVIQTIYQPNLDKMHGQTIQSE